jgi:hypothetical protein
MQLTLRLFPVVFFAIMLLVPSAPLAAQQETQSIAVPQNKAEFDALPPSIQAAIVRMYLTATTTLPTLSFELPSLSQDTPPVPSLARSGSMPDGLTSCFDYYTFGSVKATVSGSLASAVPAGSIAFAIHVTNDNPYPIVNAGVYAKLFRVKDAAKDVNGPDVVAFIPLQSGITLPAGATKALSYVWDIPAGTQPGEYRIATFVAADDRFNLRGLTFTDDVVGDIYDFRIVGDDLGAVRFAKDTVMVGDTQFRFAAFPPHVASDTASVPVTAGVTNTRTADATASIVWKLYTWDGLREDALIDTKTETLSVPAGTTAEVTYTASLTTPASVYFLTGTLTNPDGSTSFINVRFVKDGANVPRLNDVAVSGYPAEAGKTMAFACFHSTGEGDATGGRVVLTATKNSLFGGVLAQASYEGIIPGTIYALAVPFEESASSFSVTAELYHNGVLVDRATEPYDCKALGGACEGPSPLTLGAITAGLIVLIGAGIFIMRRRATHSIPPSAPLV